MTKTTTPTDGARSMTPITATTTSADGTVFAYERSGTGPAMVLVDGAMCSRDFGPTRAWPPAWRLGSPCTSTTGAVAARAVWAPTIYHPDREVEDWQTSSPLPTMTSSSWASPPGPSWRLMPPTRRCPERRREPARGRGVHVA